MNKYQLFERYVAKNITIHIYVVCVFILNNHYFFKIFFLKIKLIFTGDELFPPTDFAKTNA